MHDYNLDPNSEEAADACCNGELIDPTLEGEARELEIARIKHSIKFPKGHTKRQQSKRQAQGILTFDSPASPHTPTPSRENMNSSAATPAHLRRCANCAIAQENCESDFSICSKCNTRWYCSPECEKQDWKNGHNKVCKAIFSASSAAAQPTTIEASIKWKNTWTASFGCNQANRRLALNILQAADWDDIKDSIYKAAKDLCDKRDYEGCQGEVAVWVEWQRVTPWVHLPTEKSNPNVKLDQTPYHNVLLQTELKGLNAEKMKAVLELLEKRNWVDKLRIECM